MRSAPPPNHAVAATKCACSCGPRARAGCVRCAISEMPVAQKCGSSPRPGSACANSGENSPYTVEACTPTFSNTRPCIIAHHAAAAGLRLVGALPGGAGRSGPAAAASGLGLVPRSARSRADPWRSASNQARARCFAMLDEVQVHQITSNRVCRNASTCNHGRRHGDIERAQGSLHRDLQPRIRRRHHLVRHAHGLPSEQQDVRRLIAKIKVGDGGSGGEQQQPKAFAAAPLLESGPGIRDASTSPGRDSPFPPGGRRGRRPENPPVR